MESVLPTKASTLGFPNSMCVFKWPNGSRLPSSCSLVPPPGRTLTNCSFFLQHLNQYVWRPSKHGLLSSVWCNWWPPHRPRTSLPLCQAAGCASRGNWEGEKRFVVTTWEVGKLYAWFMKYYHLETRNWVHYPPIPANSHVCVPNPDLEAGYNTEWNRNTQHIPALESLW